MAKDNDSQIKKEAAIIKKNYGRVSDSVLLKNESFDSTSDCLFIETLDGKIIECNKACERAYGYKRSSLLKMTASDLVPGDYKVSLSSLQELIKAIDPKSNGLLVEAFGLKKNNEVFPTEVLINPIFCLENVLYLVTVRDITQRKKAEFFRHRYENQLAQLQKIDSLSKMAHELSNDFNNLLTAIMSYADLLLRDMSIQQSGKEKAKKIIEASGKARDLILQVVNCTTHLPQAFFRQIDLTMLLRDMRPALEQIVQNNAQIKYDICDSVPFINIDPSLVKFAIECLVRNAYESFSNKSGVVKISLSNGNKNLNNSMAGYFGVPQKAGGYLQISVEDNGCGIDSEQLPRIFEPFYSTKNASRGLGLSAVLCAVKSHRGGVYISSKQKDGSKVRILLPIETDNASQIRGFVDDEAYSTGNVLIISKDSNVRSTLSEYVTKLGYKTTFASDFSDGLEVFKTQNHKLSLLIVEISELDDQATELLKETGWLNPAIPVAVCAGLITDEIQQRIDKYNVAGVFEKPYKLSDLQQVFIKAQLKTLSRHLL